MSAKSSQDEIVVGWDSEYNTVDGNYVPISDQLYCDHCDIPHFLLHLQEMN